MKLRSYRHPRHQQHICLCLCATGSCIVQAASGRERKNNTCVKLFQMLQYSKCKNTSECSPRWEATAEPSPKNTAPLVSVMLDCCICWRRSMVWYGTVWIALCGHMFIFGVLDVGEHGAVLSICETRKQLWGLENANRTYWQRRKLQMGNILNIGEHVL